MLRYCCRNSTYACILTHYIGIQFLHKSLWIAILVCVCVVVCHVITPVSQKTEIALVSVSYEFPFAFNDTRIEPNCQYADARIYRICVYCNICKICITNSGNMVYIELPFLHLPTGCDIMILVRGCLVLRQLPPSRVAEIEIKLKCTGGVHG